MMHTEWTAQQVVRVQVILNPDTVVFILQMLYQYQLMLLHMSTQGIIWKWIKFIYPFFLDKVHACVSVKSIRIIHIFCCFFWVAYPINQNFTQLLCNIN